MSILNELAKKQGLVDEKEMNKLVASVNLTTPVRQTAFQHWKEVDGSKVGLLQVINGSYLHYRYQDGNMDTPEWKLNLDSVYQVLTSIRLFSKDLSEVERERIAVEKENIFHVARFITDLQETNDELKRALRVIADISSSEADGDERLMRIASLCERAMRGEFPPESE